MLTVLIRVAIFIICTFFIIFWMSKAPQIEEWDIETRVAALSDNETNFKQTQGESTRQKALN